jgi:uncharacterized protein (DUF433 family)/DNA-binding transcriptional MerR regulator
MDPTRTVLAAFSEEQTERLTGLSRSQLRYWDRTSFYSPTYAETNRRIAFSRIYSFKDIVALRVLHVLRNQYKISLQHLRDVSVKLRRLTDNPDCWIETKLYPLNGRVVWYEPGTALPQEVASGQYVASVVLSDVVQETKRAVVLLPTSRDAAKIGAVKKSKYILQNTAVLAGTRIPIATIKRFAEAGYSVEEILKEYPDITAKDVEAALNYKDSSAAA